MGLLATRYQYTSIVPTNAQVSTGMIDASLVYATRAVQDYLHRELVTATYSHWYSLEGHQGQVFLDEYPVTSVVAVAGMITVGTIYYAGASNYAMLSSDYANMYLTSLSTTTGAATTSTLPYATYPILSSLITAIQLVSGWIVNYSAGSWGTNPSRYIKPIASQMARQGVIFDSAHWIACKSIILDERTLELAGSLGRWVYVEWIGGYTFPVDNAGHTALTTAGTVPDPITVATINIARDLILLQLLNGGMTASEKLGDYEYTLARVNPMELNDIVQKQERILVPYKKFGWI